MTRRISDHNVLGKNIQYSTLPSQVIKLRTAIKKTKDPDDFDHDGYNPQLVVDNTTLSTAKSRRIFVVKIITEEREIFD